MWHEFPLLWLQHVLLELNLHQKIPIPLHFDNEGAKALAKKPEHHFCTNHIDAQYQFMWWMQESKITLLHVSTIDLLAPLCASEK